METKYTFKGTLEEMETIRTATYGFFSEMANMCIEKIDLLPGSLEVAYTLQYELNKGQTITLNARVGWEVFFSVSKEELIRQVVLLWAEDYHRMHRLVQPEINNVYN
jgi:hypothetical protein